MRIAFSDGVEIDAELVDGGAGDLALVVPSYRTAAGHLVAAAMWPVSVVDTTDRSNTGPHLKVGPRFH